MKHILALLRFAEATFFLVLALLLIVVGFLYSHGGTTPITGIMVWAGFFFILPGLFCGVDGFLRLISKESRCEKKK